MNQNLFSQLMAEKRLESAAIIAEGGSPLSYADVLAWSGRLANRLASLGLKPGDRLAVQAEKSVSGMVLYLATLRAGAVYLPLNTAYTEAELGYFLGDAEPRLFVTDPAHAERGNRLAHAIGARCETLGADGSGTLQQELELEPEAFETASREPDDMAAILYTSGTTGRSKGAMLSHRNLLSNARTLAEVWRFTADDVLLHALPIFHTHGLFVATNVSLLAGAQIRLLPRFDPDEVFRELGASTVMMGVPTFYTRLLEDPRLDRAAASGMRLFISGSAPLLAETHRAWEARTGHRILERYGMTETNMNTSNPYDGARKPGTVGPPLPDVELRVVDEHTGAAVPSGEIGVIEVKGPNVFSGYWRMPEKTSEEFRADGFFITGDMGRVDEDGYVEIVGRAKDLIITGGLNVYPKEVEEEIDALAGVLETAVIGVPDADFGEAVVAIVVPEPGSVVDPEAIRPALRDRLAAFKLPKRVYVVEQLPRNTMGKVQKNALREWVAAGGLGPESNS